ncbi:MAG TPA: LysE family translocator [Longimicrobiaceae bacterium]|nr:LysE family translocator [Longimicrobiaceae bacterium]
MPDAADLLVFMAAGLALNLTPGPDMLYVIARSAAEGRAAGIVSALGITAGGLVHTLLVALGLAGVLETVPVAYDAVRYAGAAYLIYLGVRILARREEASAGRPELRRASLGAVFRQGAVTNVLNPKVALFFLAFLPQFVDREAGNAAVQLLFLGVLFNTSGTLVNVSVALAASRAGEWSRSRLGASALFQKLTGIVFLGLGLRLVLSRRP